MSDLFTDDLIVEQSSKIESLEKEIESQRLSLEYKDGELKKLEAVYSESLRIVKEYLLNGCVDPDSIQELMDNISDYDNNNDLTRKYRGPKNEKQR